MKHILFVMSLLAVVSLVACAIQASTLTQTAASNRPTVSLVRPATPIQTPLSNVAAEEAEIRDLVENFAKRLQAVSLQAPDAAQEMEKQYAEFVSPALLDRWRSDIFNAPGRIVSSPWPDRIEITSISKESPDRYEITGFIIEVTSTEVGTDKAAVERPVRIVLERGQGRWFITEYTEENKY
jgi:hypothetical protein